MRHAKLLVLGLAVAAALPGCASTNRNAATGAAIGGLLGAGGGYAIGHHRGNRTNHALAGGLVGALAGWVIGDQIDDRNRDAWGGPETVYAVNPPYGSQYGSQYDGYGSDCAGPRREVVVRRRVVVRDRCDPYPPGW